MPRARNVDELRHGLLYNNTLEVWMALCSEQGTDWKDLLAYNNFLEHLSTNGVKLDVSVVCPPIKGFSEKPPKAYNVKLDEATVGKIRKYKPSA